ncbi:hypothetical protein C8Q74DRAFT_1373899 [Fomes fomentarius]|nr:hypothetical protein C8Q74DRAFT_1373899 [Fomes fomentarius]
MRQRISTPFDFSRTSSAGSTPSSFTALYPTLLAHHHYLPAMDAFFTITSPVPVDEPSIEEILVDSETTGSSSSHSGHCPTMLSVLVLVVLVLSGALRVATAPPNQVAPATTSPIMDVPSTLSTVPMPTEKPMDSEPTLVRRDDSTVTGAHTGTAGAGPNA